MPDELFSRLHMFEGMSNQKEKIASGFSLSAEFWENIYDDDQRGISKCYSNDMINRKAAAFRLLEKYTNSERLSILDAGCGPGIFIREAAKRGHQVVGIDSSEKMIETASGSMERNGSVVQGFFRGDIENLPFRDNSFDAVFCIGVLPYLPDDDRSISELLRVLKKGGVMIVGLPNLMRLSILLDPYYYTKCLCTYFLQLLIGDRKKSKSVTIDNYRRYFAWRLGIIFRKYTLEVLESVNVGFGPLTLWKHEFISENRSIRISNFLEKLSEGWLFNFLKNVVNHWVICLQKIKD